LGVTIREVQESCNSTYGLHTKYYAEHL
jgi:hypothetical protein